MQLIHPLCDATARLFAPLHFYSTDRLHVDLDPHDDRWFLLRVTSTKYSSWSFSPAARSFLRRLPEQRAAAYDAVRASATDTTALLIHELWVSHPAIEWANDYAEYEAPRRVLIPRVTFSEKAKTVYDSLLTRFAQQQSRAVMRANWHETGAMPPNIHSDDGDCALTPYQQIALHSTMGTDGSALFMEQGTGKTAVAVRRICEESKTFDRPMRVIVVSPKSVRANWGAELEKFATTCGSYVVLRGGKLDRVKQLVELFQQGNGSKWLVCIASYDAVIRTWDAIQMIEWDLAILDESHAIKSVWTRRKNHMMQLRDISAERLILTGTPISNSVLDLYAQLEFLGQGLSGFNSWQAFRKFYCKMERRGQFDIITGTKNLPLLQERLARFAFMIDKEKALPYLPKKCYSLIEVQMTKAQRKAYRSLAKKLYVEITEMLDAAEEAKGDQRRVTVNNVLTKLLRLTQVTSGFVRWDDTLAEDGESTIRGDITYFDPNPKTVALLELIASMPPAEKVVVWCTFVSDIRHLKGELEKAGHRVVTYYGETSDADRETAVKEFNTNPSVRIFLGNPAAGGAGINLWGYDPASAESETNATKVVYFSQNWSMVQRAQSEDRTHRIGTRTSVEFIDLVIPATIDEEIRARVVGKRIHAMEVQDVRDIMRQLCDTVEVDDDE